MARQVCQRRRGQKQQFPILLYLRDHAAAVVADPDIALTPCCACTLGELRLAEPDGWFEQRLREGECVVLLDGLDEVARPKTAGRWPPRRNVRSASTRATTTSLPHVHRATASPRIDGADMLQARGFTTEQVSRFRVRLVLAVERHSTGAADETSPSTLDEKPMTCFSAWTALLPSMT